ncbi:MAG: acyclic terpene utilization AtuA family protein [Nocardioidaceae bacterium]
MNEARGPLRVGNCSGFYGDRLSAMREMLEAPDAPGLDVLTGDYLAELTMLILGRDQMKDPSLGYARTFLRQAEDCMGLALEKGVRIVANAGGLNPTGLADKLREVAHGLGLHPAIAHVHGDNLIDRAEALGLAEGGAKPLTANAYLGAFGIAAALERGADIVVTGRVTDASVVVGPAIARFGWTPESYDELAGAVAAGHVIECGAQATGGNFSGFVFDERPLGFPLAEIHADGSSVITKHAGTGGAVTVDTVTAQLVYEVQSQTYLGPDVALHLDSLALSPDGEDRVRISGVRGSAPPAELKVCVNELGGFRNQMELVLVGLDIDAKADWVRAQVEAAWTRGRRPASVEWTLARTDREDAATEEAASCRLRCSVKDADPQVVGKRFTAPLVELALASYPGFTMTTPPAPATPYGVYRAAYVDRSQVTETVVFPDGSTEQIPAPPLVEEGGAPAEPVSKPAHPNGFETLAPQPTGQAAMRRLPLGTFVHARSGDKGGDANIGLWVADAAHHPERVDWLLGFVTPDRVKRLVPEAEGLDVAVYPLPNLGAVNVVVRGLLGEGVAASTRFDPQAKALGEWVRSRHVDIPEGLL